MFMSRWVKTGPGRAMLAVMAALPLAAIWVVVSPLSSQDSGSSTVRRPKVASTQTVRTGATVTWGFNRRGGLGDDTSVTRTSPVTVLGLGADSGVVDISLGDDHGLALKTDGTVLAWGSNAHGQVGNGTTDDPTRATPVVGLGAGSKVISIQAGADHSLALKSDGTVLAWGRNSSGELGNDTLVPGRVPALVKGLGPGSGVTAISTRGRHSLALKSDGTVLAWGKNTHGQVGDGTTTDLFHPVVVSGMAAGSGVVALSGSYYHSLALKRDGSVWSWGINVHANLGDGTTTDRLTPGPVVGLGEGSGVTAISGGGVHSLALKADGTVLAWGANYDGGVGDGTAEMRLTPVPVSGFGAKSGVVAITASYHHNMAMKSDGSVWAWGLNDHGQLGDGTTTTRLVPVTVAGLDAGGGAIAIGAGFEHGAALITKKPPATTVTTAPVAVIP